MAEPQEKDARTEEATPKKIQDALDKGNTPHSREISSAFSMLTIGLLLWIYADPIGLRIGVFLSQFIDRPYDFRLSTGEHAVELLMLVAVDVGAGVLAIVAVLLVTGVLSGGVQNTPRIVFDRIEPKWSRLSLAQGLKRIFGARGQFELLKSIAKLLIVSLVGLTVLQQFQYLTIDPMMTDPSKLPEALTGHLSVLVFSIATCFALLAAIDFIWSRRQWLVDLRMSKQEIKDEHKQTEGDPLLKARLRSIQRDRARRRMISQVPTASVVIVNPTHYAVALRYDRGVDPAPRVVALGLDAVALKIREAAEANDIPTIEDKELARALYAAVRLDQQIPNEFFKPIAEILIYISKKDGKAARGLR